MEVDVLKKVPVREQDAATRATNFEEVCLGYNEEEAVCEASRCINCKNAQCMKGCPGKVKRTLTEKEEQTAIKNALHYVELAKEELSIKTFD